MAKQFQRRRFQRNRPIRNKNCMWLPCLLTDRDEMSNLHRGHSIDASYQVLVVAMFVNDRDEMSNLHRGHSIDAAYQVSVHLAKRFQRRRFKKLANQKQELPVAVMSGNGSYQNVHSLERTSFHRCFLPSFSSFG